MGPPRTMNYYDVNAEAFVARTADVDIDHLRDPFLAELPPGGRILDAGCGSGRDAYVFARRGFQVTALDGSLEMVKAARRRTALDVIHSTFLDFQSDEPFHGVWACASLLHVAPAQLAHTLAHLCELLTPGGVLYASFRFGNGERIEGERYFNDQTPDQLAELAHRVAGVFLDRAWVTDSAVVAGQRWTNGWFRRQAR